MALPPNTRLGRYEVRSQIGAGGMGEVYLAWDVQLDRRVALKLLPAGVSSDQERMRRFVREAKAAAALNHPNIAHVYEIGEAAGMNFIAMEFIDGVTLREKIHQAKLDPLRLLDYLTQAAEGLVKAHAAGIIHRDLKPENVMVTQDGYVKLLDFGLAKLIESPAAAQPPREAAHSSAQTAKLPAPLSQPGMIMGTVGYMSPEQARGKSEAVDQRSDIFSFGCMLYEAASGHRPFEGDSEIDTLCKVIYEAPPPIGDTGRPVPPELLRIIRKCLEKDPEDRYQLIKEVASDLKSLRREMEMSAGSAGGFASAPHESAGGVNSRAEAVAPASARKSRQSRAVHSLAVLPLVNVGGDPNIEYLSDGITESLINNLSQLPRLRVMARATAFRYKGLEVDPQDVGRELGVRAVLVGRVLQRAERLVIRVELVDVADGSQLWGEHYNRQLTDIFMIEEEIARELSEKLRLRLSPKEKKRLGKRHTDNTEAYQLYLKGRYHWNRRTEEEIRKGIDYFRQAIEADPGYALAYAGLADSYIVLIVHSGLPADELRSQAKAAVMRALELDDALAEAHTSLAAIGDDEWGLSGAEREFKRALTLNPNYAPARQWYAEYLSHVGRHEEALAEIRRAQELDPLSLITNAAAGHMLLLARRFDEARRQLEKTISMDRNFPLAHRSLGSVYIEQGMYEQAIDEHHIADVLSGESPDAAARRAATLKEAYGASGAQGYWRAQLKLLRENTAGCRASPSRIASIHARLGEADAALECLRRAYQERDVELINRLNTDVAFDPLRDHPEFKYLRRRIGLAT